MNLTISVDEELLRRARELARHRGISVQELLRSYLRNLVGELPAEEVKRELLALMAKRGGHSGGRRIGREEAYETRL